MDDPALDPGDHAAALRGLARLNRVSLAGAALGPEVRRFCGADRTLNVLDVATGSGDVPLALWRRARRAGIDLRWVLCDTSPFALERAKDRFGACGVAAEFIRLDAAADPLPSADVAICSLFLHHLDEAGVVRVLSAMKGAARRGVLACDLRRSATGTVLARIVPRLLTRSRVVHTDAVLSARAAWTIQELRTLAARAGLGHAPIRPSFPSRMLLRWEREEMP